MRIVWLVVLAACGAKKPVEDAPVAHAPPPGDGTAPVGVAGDAGSTQPDAGAPTRTEHAVFSLVDNRHAAHRYANGELVIDASDIGFVRYGRFAMPAPRWAVGKTVGGVRGTIVDRNATLEAPLDAKLAKTVTRLIVRVHGKAKQVLALRINGKRPTEVAKTSRVELVDGWQTVAFPIDAGRLVSGENQIGFETSGPAGKLGVEWMRFSADATKLDDPRPAIAFDAGADSLVLAKDATLVWYITVPEGAHLVAKEVTADCKVEVQAQAGDESFAGGNLTRTSTRVDLTAISGKVVGLTLTARDCAKAKIVAPEIRIHGPAPVALPKAEPPRYVMLWIMDALRADKIPVFRPGARAQTPNIDELAKSSVVFRQYYVQGNESQVSHSTMWTGLYPAVHKVKPIGASAVYRIDKKLDVLAAKLKEAGYRTESVTGNGFVNEYGGYARGFDKYRNMMREKGVINGILYGDQIVAPALARIEANRANPLYLYMGTVDTHGPWIARKPWIDIYSPPPYNGPFTLSGTADGLGIKPDSMGCHKIPAPADIERMRAIYDSAISYQDKLVGEVIAKLKSWGIWDKTMLIITADHGEEWFEDGRCNHGGSLRDSLVNVPMLIHDPARFPGGTIVEEGVEAVDLFPTVLDSVGIAKPDAIQGTSMAPLAQGFGRGWPRPSYASMFEISHAMRIGKWKMKVGPQGVPVLFELKFDTLTDEKVDLAAQRPVERRMMTDNLATFLALRTVWKKSAWGVTTNVTKAGAAELDRAETP